MKCADWIPKSFVDELLDFYKYPEFKFHDQAVVCPGKSRIKLTSGSGGINRNWVKTPTKEQDTFWISVAAICIGEKKERFYESYRDYKDIVKKFDLMVPLVQRFKKANF